MKYLAIIVLLFLSACVGDVKKSDTDANLRLEIAIGHIKRANYPLALKELLIAQDLDPKNPIVQSYLGFIYFLRERYDLAEEHYKRAIQFDPKFSDAKNNLARVYIETNQPLLADKLLAEVLVDYTYTDFPRAYLNKGILEFNRKKYPEAIEFLRKTISTDRDSCIAHVYLGRSYMAKNDLKLAVDQLNRSVTFCKSLNSDEGHYYSAIALFRANEKDLSKARFAEMISLFPNGKHVDNGRKMLELIEKGDL